MSQEEILEIEKMLLDMKEIDFLERCRLLARDVLPEMPGKVSLPKKAFQRLVSIALSARTLSLKQQSQALEFMRILIANGHNVTFEWKNLGTRDVSPHVAVVKWQGRD